MDNRNCIIEFKSIKNTSKSKNNFRTNHQHPGHQGPGTQLAHDSCRHSNCYGNLTFYILILNYSLYVMYDTVYFDIFTILHYISLQILKIELLNFCGLFLD